MIVCALVSRFLVCANNALALSLLNLAGKEAL